MLRLGDAIEIFLFTENNFDSVENLVLITLWDYVYKKRFNPEKYSICMFTKYLKLKIDYFALVSCSLKLRSLLVTSVLERYNNDANHNR